MYAKQPKQHHRNPTPNFIRFKKTSTPPPQPPTKPNSSSQKASQRSSSRTSKCSFQYYQKKILKNTFTKFSPYEKQKLSQKVFDKRENKFIKNIVCSRSNSNASEGSTGGKRDTSAGGKESVKKKRVPANSNSKQKTPKRNEASLEKEELRAKEEKNEVMKMLTKSRNPPTFVNKMKLKKEDSNNNRRSNKPSTLATKRSFFNDPTILTKDITELNNYEIYGELGKGAYGVVRMAYDKIRNDKVAIKIYEKKKIDDPSKLRNIEREISIQAKVSHPTIARIIDTIESAQEIYLIIQYGGANSLYKYILSKPQHRLDQDEAKEFFKTLVQAIYHLHSQGIVHRDIKAENILINRDRKLKLIDFGFSLVSSPPHEIDTFCGTPTYMAPEIVSRIDHVAMYTDVWSLGVLLYVLLQGNYPFRAKNEDELFQKIKRGNYGWIYEDISAGSRGMVKGLLNVEPGKRPRLGELVESEEWRKWVGEG